MIEPKIFSSWRARKRAHKNPGKIGNDDQFQTERLGNHKERSGKKSIGNSTRKRLIALILCLCFGIFGIHRFYAGKPLSAKVQLFTIGGLGIWFLIDLIYIIVGEFVDGDGKKIRDWA